MKALLTILSVGIALTAAAADPAAPRPAHPAPPDLAALEQFLNLPDTELARMAEALARVRAMTPAQRAALRDEIAAFRKLPEPERMQLRQGWGWMPPEIQDGWREMMQSTTPEEHAAIQAKLQTLPAPEKLAFRRKLVEQYLKAKTEKK